MTSVPILLTGTQFRSSDVLHALSSQLFNEKMQILSTYKDKQIDTNKEFLFPTIPENLEPTKNHNKK